MNCEWTEVAVWTISDRLRKSENIPSPPWSLLFMVFDWQGFRQGCSNFTFTIGILAFAKGSISQLILKLYHLHNAWFKKYNLIIKYWIISFLSVLISFIHLIQTMWCNSSNYSQLTLLVTVPLCTCSWWQLNAIIRAGAGIAEQPDIVIVLNTKP